MYADLHRHDEHSLFDGFGKPQDLVKIAKDLGYEALGLTNHGDMAGLISHYLACKNEGLKPILGNEVYFQPNFRKKRKSFHLCLFVKNLEGYKNLNKIVTEANKEDHFYYKALIDFELLKKYHKGLICSAACIGGLIPQMLVNDRYDLAKKYALEFKSIFKDDFYFEIQPYKLTEEGLQEKNNELLMDLAEELNIKCILTSDSHFGSPEDFDTYLVMHDIANHKEFGMQYEERYMPSEEHIIKRFVKMHYKRFNNKKEAKRYAINCIDNIQTIVDSVDDDVLDKLPLNLPVFDENIDSNKLLMKNIKSGLKKRGKFNKRYLNRCKEEYEVITYHGFADYFLMVQDYVKWAKDNDISVGPGRGSVCNSLVAYALEITDVDSLVFELDFRRFLRKDKKKYPDIDMDFETDKRGEVINYLLKRYDGHAARICSYGLYRVDNLLNDLFKVCGLNAITCDEEDKQDIINKQKEIKRVMKHYINEENNDFMYDEALQDDFLYDVNEKYNNIIKHFNKLYKKIRFYGTHAAGVAISGDNILNYTAIERRSKDAYTTSYDLNDIENINVIKFDMLGLRTMSILKELRDLVGKPHYFDYNLLNDKKIFDQFRIANTDGIFQFEAKGAKNILKTIDANCYDDVIAASALNRPGPLSLGMVEEYAENKRKYLNGELDEDSHNENIFYKYTKETFGTFVYQEQVMRICVEMAGMTWGDADKIMKFMKGSSGMTEKALQVKLQEEDRLRNLFVDGAVKNGYSKKIANESFDKLLVYTFNKGHAVGYALVSIEQMYYKIYHNTQFWFVTLKYGNEKDLPRLSAKAVKDGCVILLPHVNGNAKHSLTKIDNEYCIREGLCTIKGVGEKAAVLIEQIRKEGGRFKNEDDFFDRIEDYRRIINKRVIDALKENGALEFKNKIYFGRCQKYNSALYSRAMR
uniref:DNA polymerase III subunit alpha n=1 Tax=Methanobrevibacter smithii TaxID=2173 RepID=UPI0037DBF337